jgi:hypothetical protein
MAYLVLRMRQLTVFLVLFSAGLSAQVGGISVFEFLNLPNSATVAAMGGHHIALMDDDLSLAARNPSLLNEQMHQRAAISHAFHPAGISNSYLGYGHHHDRLGLTFQGGLQFTNYGGDLVRRDPTGQAQGYFFRFRFCAHGGGGASVRRPTIGGGKPQAHFFSACRIQ